MERPFPLWEQGHGHLQDQQRRPRLINCNLVRRPSKNFMKIAQPRIHPQIFSLLEQLHSHPSIRIALRPAQDPVLTSMPHHPQASRKRSPLQMTARECKFEWKRHSSFPLRLRWDPDPDPAQDSGRRRHYLSPPQTHRSGALLRAALMMPLTHQHSLTRLRSCASVPLNPPSHRFQHCHHVRDQLLLPGTMTGTR